MDPLDPFDPSSSVARCRSADAGFEFVDDAKVVGVPDGARVGRVGTAHEAGGLEVGGAKLAETNAGEVQSKGDGEEGHGGSHRKPGLQHGLTDRTEAVGDAGSEGKDFDGGEGRLHDCAGNEHRAAKDGGGGMDAEPVVRAEDDGRVGQGGVFAAGLGDDALQQGGGGSGAGVLQHLQPSGSALSVGEHLRCRGRPQHVAVEGGLVGGGERAVERVGEHRLALRAVCAVAGLAASASCPRTAASGLPNCLLSASLNHLPFYTLQKPCKFPAAAADAALHGALGDAQNLRNLLVIHVFQVAQDDRLAQLRRELRERLLDAWP